MTVLTSLVSPMSRTSPLPSPHAPPPLTTPAGGTLRIASRDAFAAPHIDPALLAAPRAVLHEHARDVLRRGLTAPGHVVNLGHGVPPEADPDVLSELVTFIHKETR